MESQQQNLNPYSSHKRLRATSDSDSESDAGSPGLSVLPTWPTFLRIESVDENKPISKLSPFAIQKGIQGLAGEPKTVKKLRSGSLLVEVTKQVHSRNLLRCNIMVDIPVKVSPHRSLNTSKGIIRSRDLEGCPDDEILHELKEQGVIDVKRISVRRNGQMKETNTFILTFAMTILPSSVKAGYLSIRVDQYIPNPLRCL